MSTNFHPKMSSTQVKISTRDACSFFLLSPFPSSNKSDVQSNDDSTNTCVTQKNTPDLENGEDERDENVIELDHANSSDLRIQEYTFVNIVRKIWSTLCLIETTEVTMKNFE